MIDYKQTWYKVTKNGQQIHSSQFKYLAEAYVPHKTNGDKWEIVEVLGQEDERMKRES